MTEVIDFLISEALLSTSTIILISLLIGSFLADNFRKYKIIDTNEAISLMDNKNLIIIDVRTEKERKKYHIAGDIHIPINQIKNKINVLDKNKKILLYCNKGMLANNSARLLTRHQFTQVYSLKNGIQAWIKNNLPIIK